MFAGLIVGQDAISQVNPGESRVGRSTMDMRFWSIVVAACVLLAFAVTATSLWIDEGFTAWVVRHRPFHSLVETLAGPLPSASDRQYPLYDIWLWGWSRLFGSSEYSLRAANIPFGVIFVIALAQTSRLVFKRSVAWLPFAFAPFVWFYMNEARPYIMLGSCATAAVGAMLVYTFGPERNRKASIWLFCTAFLASCLAHVLAVLCFPGLAVLAVTAILRGRPPRWSEWRGPVLLCGPLLLASLVFYTSTLTGSNGRDEIEVNRRASPSHGAVAFVFAGQILYEHAGFAGLGPPRNALRVDKVEIVHGPYLIWLVFGATGLVVFCYFALRRPRSRTVSVLALAWVASFIFAIGIAYALHARFLGRHAAAILPFLLFAVLSVCRSRVQVLALALVVATSDVRLALLPEYWKDDYRGAAQDVIKRVQAAPGIIDWVADGFTAGYYGLDLRRDIGGGTRTDVGRIEHDGELNAGNLCASEVSSLLRVQRLRHIPIYVAISKPDLFDMCGGWRSEIAARHAIPVVKYRTFDIYEID
jgi:hypothetical protein